MIENLLDLINNSLTLQGEMKSPSSLIYVIFLFYNESHAWFAESVIIRSQLVQRLMLLAVMLSAFDTSLALHPSWDAMGHS